MRNVSITKKRNVLLIWTTGVLCFGLLSFISPHTVSAVDTDYDGIDDLVDNCPNMGNPRQHDFDKDGIGIVCDNLEPDRDNDGVADIIDNCPDDPNPKQYDSDKDGIGLVCDNLDDPDNDGISFAEDNDNCPADPNPKQYDLDKDGIGLVCDGDIIGDQARIDRLMALEADAIFWRARHLSLETLAMDNRARLIWVEEDAFMHVIRNRNEPGPKFGCTGCHDTTVFGKRREIVGENGDFAMNSHHVRGNVTADLDCLACHYTGDHGSGIVKLADPDHATDVIYEYNPATPETLEPFCLACHDNDGAAAGYGITPFSDGVDVPNVKAGGQWASSAHGSIPYAVNGGRPITCLGDGVINGCHANGHGSVNYKIMTADTRLDVSCANCHIGYDTLYNNGSHPMGQSIIANGNAYIMMCTTCHNPHLVRDQVYLETEPDFTSDPVTNLYAMGTTLTSGWGCVACHDY